MNLEDESETANTIVTPQLFERCRLLISEEPFLIIEGVVQNIDRVIHVKAKASGAIMPPDPAAEARDLHGPAMILPLHDLPVDRGFSPAEASGWRFAPAVAVQGAMAGHYE